MTVHRGQVNPAPVSAPGPPHSIRRIERGFLAFGLIALGATGIGYAQAAFYQASQSHRLEQALEQHRREELVRDWRKGSPSSSLPAGGVVGRIEVPRRGVSAIIGEGIDAKTLGLAVGHVPGTAMPGEPGNVAVSGHRDTFFRGLKEIAVGDTVRIQTLDGWFVYCVDSTAVVSSNRIDYVAPTEARTLTLITCYPFHYVGPAPRRFVVRARQIETS